MADCFKEINRAQNLQQKTHTIKRVCNPQKPWPSHPEIDVLHAMVVIRITHQTSNFLV